MAQEQEKAKRKVDVGTRMYEAPWRFFPATVTKFAYHRLLNSQVESKTNPCSFTVRDTVGVSCGLFDNQFRETLQKLTDMAVPSMVGKGTATMLDASVRRSLEIPAADVALQPDFLAHLESAATQLLPFLSTRVHAGSRIRLKLHKLLVYNAGAFFAPHMDALHSGPEWPLTLSVEIGGDSDTRGGQLFLQLPGYVRDMEDEHAPICGHQPVPLDYVPVPTADWQHVRLALFYHDVKHCVSTQSCGRRLVLTFDAQCYEEKEHKDNLNRKRKLDQVQGVECPPDISWHDWQKYVHVADAIRQLGFPRLGVLCSHAYCDVPRAEHLKGQDAVLYQIMAALCAPDSLQVIPLVETDTDRLFHRSIVPLMETSTTFGALLNEHEEPEEDDHEDDQGDEGDEGDEGDHEDDLSDEDKHVSPSADGVDDKQAVLFDKDDDDSLARRTAENDALSVYFAATGVVGTIGEYLHAPTDVRKQLNVLEEMMQHNGAFSRQGAPRVKYDDGNEYRMVVDDPTYRLGDVFFIKSQDVHRRTAYTASEEVHLGNQGFDGEFHDLIGIVGRLNVS